jgi:hypothetical protein
MILDYQGHQDILNNIGMVVEFAKKPTIFML